MSLRYVGLRNQLVKKLAGCGITDKAVLEAIGKVERHLFVDPSFVDRAYANIALPLSDNQTISQPYTVAYQTEKLNLKPGERVLEIGLGSGYQCAVLCQMGIRVFSIERNPTLFNKAKTTLAELGYNPTLMLGDGTLGWPQWAPFDGILVTAGGPSVPQALKSQLKIGGRMIIPIGDKASQRMFRITRTSEHDFTTETFDIFRFVPLIGAQGWQDD